MVREVSKTYQTASGQVPAVDRITLTVFEQEFLTILGPSGCAKSTLLGMVGGLVKPDSGTILLNGLPTNGVNPSVVAMVFQDAGLFPWRTALDNVGFGLELQGCRPRGSVRSHGDCSSRWGCAASRPSIRASCPGECASAWPSRARSRSARPSFELWEDIDEAMRRNGRVDGERCTLARWLRHPRGVGERATDVCHQLRGESHHGCVGVVAGSECGAGAGV